MELEKTIRDRIEATRPKPPIDKLREQARAMGQPVINLQERLPKLSFNNASLRGILDFIGTSAGINITYEASFSDRAYTINLEDVTVEQALQQIMMANSLFYKVVNQKTIMVIPDNAPNRAKYDDIVVRVFYISHGDAPEIATIINSMTRITTMPVQPQVAAEQDGEHDHRARDGAGRRDHRADHPRQRQAARRGRHRRPDPGSQPPAGQAARA